MGRVEWALLLLLALLWGGSFFFSKIAVGELPPLTVVLCRVALAALALNAVVVLGGRRMPANPRPGGALFTTRALQEIPGRDRDRERGEVRGGGEPPDAGASRADPPRRQPRTTRSAPFVAPLARGLQRERLGSSAPGLITLPLQVGLLRAQVPRLAG